MKCFVFVIAVLIVSCSGPSVPKDVLPPDKMEAVLYDIIHADEFFDFYSLQDTAFQKKAKRISLYDSISHIHSISKETFQKSWRYYQDRPDMLKEIFESLYEKADTTKQKQSLKKFTRNR